MIPSSSERLSPFLFQRLTDHDPLRQVESAFERTTSLPSYQKAVKEHLGWLFSTTAHFPEEWMERFPEAARSVVNFGLANVKGKTVLDFDELRRRFREALAIFEPRIQAETLQILVEGKPKTKGAAGEESFSQEGQAPEILVLEISGYLLARPVPQYFLITTRIDIANETVSLTD